MLNQFSRTQLLLGEEGMKKLAGARVAVFGIGGVEMCIRDRDIPTFEFKTVDMTQLEPYIQNPNRNVVRMLLKTLAYEHQDDLLPAKWEIEHIFPQKWQTNYFPDEPDATIKEKIAVSYTHLYHLSSM